jgi:hypothetical protein
MTGTVQDYGFGSSKRKTIIEQLQQQLDDDDDMTMTYKVIMDKQDYGTRRKKRCLCILLAVAVALVSFLSIGLGVSAKNRNEDEASVAALMEDDTDHCPQGVGVVSQSNQVQIKMH